MEKVNKYSSIINLPHHVSKVHEQMPMIDRAAQFAPFTALTGYDSEIKETARYVGEKIELEDEVLVSLNSKILKLMECIKQKPLVNFVVFKEDDHKDGGEYITITGAVKKIDEIERKIILQDKTSISINNILDISGDIFKDLA